VNVTFLFKQKGNTDQNNNFTVYK